MKILHVIPTMDPAAGGPTRVVADLSINQVKAGHRVWVCTTDRGHPPSKALDPNGVKPLVEAGVEVQRFSVDFRPLLYSRKMGAWLMENISHFDIVHVHGLYRFPLTYAGHCARLKGVPYVVTPHGTLDPYLYRRSSTSLLLKRLYEGWFEWPNLNAAGAIHYTAEEERQRAAFLNIRAPSFVVPNGIDWARFEHLPERGTFRTRLGLGDAPLVLFLGRLNFTKGLDLLIPAFAEVRRLHPAAQLAIVGPDNEGYGANVRRWVQEHNLIRQVHFVGRLDGSDVIQAYVDADVFVLPSYTENFGMAVVEAMACGTPVVISDQVNICREIAAAGAGLVTRCDVDEVAKALIGLLDDADRRQEMGAAGRRGARERYTWPPIVEALTREYEAVISRVRGSRRTSSAALMERGSDAS